MSQRLAHSSLNGLVGRLAEMIVALHLSIKGYMLLCRRYRNPHCELDLVCIKSGVLLFAEVKFRSSLQAVETTVDYSRMERMYPASESFCSEFQLYYYLERIFKVFLITPSVIQVITL
ncbi:conserved hypothetical protein [Neorickettsia risticii str. Illinois]|uniref:Uncharacterized protein n=1 Tax=Neorickettsia risticii (strain Illinois) TaxID=434131 RepID=C6V4V5_NEORI|nr:YraN family protein [Neorickettsia risticii]ACT69416.1 conserved hypothetical protein [Neorickettsia risticii str. Illinois]